jgi:hypothetical protein
MAAARFTLALAMAASGLWERASSYGAWVSKRVLLRHIARGGVALHAIGSHNVSK